MECRNEDLNLELFFDLLKQELQKNDAKLEYCVESVSGRQYKSRAFVTLDLSKHDQNYLDEIRELKYRNEHLQKELEDAQQNAPGLPFDPIDVASMLINEKYEVEHNKVNAALYGKSTYLCNKYSTNELRQIAGHLMVYCENCEDE